MALLNLHGQVAQPPPFAILADTVSEQVIPDHHVLFMEDPNGKMDLAAARLALREGKFRPWSDSIAKKGMKRETYWFHYRLENRTGKNYETGLDSWSNISRFYVIRQGDSIETLVTGDNVSNRLKKEFLNFNIAPVGMRANESIEVFYQAHFNTSRFLRNFAIQVVEPNRYARSRLKLNEPNFIPRSAAINGFFSGIMLITALIYLVFFYLGREKVYLYFALMLLCFGTEGNFSHELTSDFPQTRILFNIIGLSGFYFLCHFCRFYLKTASNLPRWDKVLLILANLMLVVGIAEVFGNTDLSEVATAVLIPVNVGCIVITFFLLGNRMQKEKKFLRYALLPFLVFIPFLFVIIISSMLLGTGQGIFNTPALIWMSRHISLMVGLTFTWMIISFSRILFRQFIEQRQRIHDQEKEKEKMKLEQELERAKLVEKQKEDLEHQVAERTAELKLSLENLKATQAQLIQNEKMASLGEMTAGIAHEIQNPLNFVNNFAEVNVELADEIKSELASAVPDEKRRTLLFELLDSMAGNQEKIRMHGKRADNIVKNMLQHSRAGASKKEATDLNALVEEYTKLSYHGLRARDKSFNAGYELDLDPSLGKAEILPQEFGRVVLNLVNNAFYAVSEKMKQGIPGYAPGIIVQTRAIFGNGSGSTQKKPGSDTSPVSFMLTVRDNGPGIPDRVKEKIFQPFFTTKPSGEGTGLGLSISYDIITKGHGGRIWATSEDGAGTTFHVEIPTGK